MGRILPLSILVFWFWGILSFPLLGVDLSITNPSESSISVSDQPIVSDLTLNSISVIPVIFSLDNSDVTVLVEAPLEDEEDDTSELTIESKILNYPNPFSLSKDRVTSIGYALSRRATVRIQIFSLQGYLVYTLDIPKSAVGGRAGYNRVEINPQLLNGAVLTPGVYLYVLMGEGKVLSKNKMVVTP